MNAAEPERVWAPELEPEAPGFEQTILISDDVRYVQKFAEDAYGRLAEWAVVQLRRVEGRWHRVAVYDICHGLNPARPGPPHPSRARHGSSGWGEAPLDVVGLHVVLAEPEQVTLWCERRRQITPRLIRVQFVEQRTKCAERGSG